MGPDPRARIRALLAMEALVHDDIAISEHDINRIEKAVREGKRFEAVFPRLNSIDSETAGEGTTITVHFSKKAGAPVRFFTGDDPEGAAAVREIDLQKKFHLRAKELATALGLTEPRSLALRRHLGIDTDPTCARVFEFGRTRIPCYSDNARTKMRAAIDSGLDMETVWRTYRPGGGNVDG